MMMKKITSCVMLMMMLMCVTNVSAQWSVTPEAGMNVTKYKNAPAAIGFKAGAAVSYTFGSGLFSIQSGLYYVQRGTGKSLYGGATGKMMDKEGNWVDCNLDFPSGYLSNYESGIIVDFDRWGGYVREDLVTFPVDMRIETLYSRERSFRRDYLQLPVLARFNWKIGNQVKMHVAAGPYLACGIGGKIKDKFVQISEKGIWKPDDSSNPFKDSSLTRFDWGVALNAGVEVNRLTFDVAYDMGLAKEFGNYIDDISIKYHTVSFTVGYKF